jgi:hypothetical protein
MWDMFEICRKCQPHVPLKCCKNYSEARILHISSGSVLHSKMLPGSGHFKTTLAVEVETKGDKLKNISMFNNTWEKYGTHLKSLLWLSQSLSRNYFLHVLS